MFVNHLDAQFCVGLIDRFRIADSAGMQRDLADILAHARWSKPSESGPLNPIPSGIERDSGSALGLNVNAARSTLTINRR